MLIDVFDSRNHSDTKSIGCFHFARSPVPGEHVEIDGRVRMVTRAWHQPSIYCAGAKYAILISDQTTPINDTPLTIPIHDDAEEVI
ncbi:hypothetical protein NT2_12_01230 [Caenibius tardaugens NBRC 16725]|uniref:Uncharacterized protein n=1 Tax=Caenibius tardaugens NBRC 16725 TaxID=1219035 RepID=U2ZZR7_9SPHN|nr:hypothetical protein [Caenibius tardaugens]AZI36337.1 hypothetical protein EGO55_10555 [Caenibius tardaugens NBRC 16725]GAD50864.1 hypothetical protein NT2_12_01230 [Caenibius tardaugens NBRC 16725]